MVTVLVVNGESNGWWARLRHEWTKNDGKPWEEWAPGRDLKETVLIAVAVLVVLLQIAAFAAGIFG